MPDAQDQPPQDAEEHLTHGRPQTQLVYQPAQRLGTMPPCVFKQQSSTALPTAFGQSPHGWPETSAYRTGTPGAFVPHGQQALPPTLAANTPWSPLPCAGQSHPAAPVYSSYSQATPTCYSQWPQNESNWALYPVYNPFDPQQQPSEVIFNDPYNQQQYDHDFGPSALPSFFPTQRTEAPNGALAPLRLRPKL